MAADKNIFDEQLRELLGNQQVPAPQGSWNDMSNALDQINQRLSFDQGLREAVQDAWVNPPSTVWTAVQGGVSAASAGMGIIGKLIIGAAIMGGVATTWFVVKESSDDNTPEIAVIEKTELPQPSARSKENITTDQTRTVQEETPEMSSAESTVPEETSDNPKLTNPLSGGGTYSDKGSSVKPGELPPPVNPNASGPVKTKSPVIPSPAKATLFLNDKSLCNGETLHGQVMNANGAEVQVSIDGNSWLAVNPDGAFAIQAPEDNGTYTLKAIIGARENQVSLQESFQVIKTAEPEFEIRDIGEAQYEFIATGEIKGSEISWRVDHLMDGGGEKHKKRFIDSWPKEHRVVIILEKDGCIDSLGKNFNNIDVIRISLPNIPNPFTPNGDGLNDRWDIRIEGEVLFHLMIYDMSNKLVFESKDKNHQWDGRHFQSGENCAQGEYHYVLRYQLITDNEPKIKQGTVGIFR